MEQVIQTDWLSYHYHTIGFLVLGLFVASVLVIFFDILWHYFTHHARRRFSNEEYMVEALGVLVGDGSDRPKPTPTNQSSSVCHRGSDRSSGSSE